MPAYDTVTEALSDLKLRGFTTDFNLAFDSIKCSATDVCLSPADFEIIEHYRFEGPSDPADEAVVYAIHSKDDKMKGTLVTAYGANSETINDELIKKLAIHE
jgi:hypothetical protein